MGHGGPITDDMSHVYANTYDAPISKGAKGCCALHPGIESGGQQVELENKWVLTTMENE